MTKSKRNMPSELAIRKHWAGRLSATKGYDSPSEFLERGSCFACGLDGSERAHIVARSVGGSDLAENLHILCATCHKDSEYLDGHKYTAWFLERNAFDCLISKAMRCGFNPSKFVGALIPVAIEKAP